MIKEAAIKIEDTVFTGKRHCDCFRTMDAHVARMAGGIEIQGFVTEDGIFMDRKEALIHAIACGQIEKGKWGEELYSEDLY